jgi:hypothetical protein
MVRHVRVRHVIVRHVRTMNGGVRHVIAWCLIAMLLMFREVR